MTTNKNKCKHKDDIDLDRLSKSILLSDEDLTFEANEYTVIINKDIIIKKVWANDIVQAYTQALLKVYELRELEWNRIHYTTEQTN